MKFLVILVLIISVVVGYLVFSSKKSKTPPGEKKTAKEAPAVAKAPKPAKKKDDRVLVIARELVEKKGDVNQRYDSRMKPNGKKIPILVWAIAHRNVEAVKLLLEAGADPNIKPLPRSGESAIFEAISSDGLVNSEWDLEREKNGVKIVGLLLKNGAEVNFQARATKSFPLHKAAACGREDIAKLLIKKGAKVKVKDVIGNSPLHMAAKYGYWKLVELLLKEGVGVNVKNHLGATPLALAEKRQDEDLHQKVRKVTPDAYEFADYDRTIKVLKKHRARK